MTQKFDTGLQSRPPSDMKIPFDARTLMFPPLLRCPCVSAKLHLLIALSSVSGDMNLLTSSRMEVDHKSRCAAVRKRDTRHVGFRKADGQ